MDQTENQFNQQLCAFLDASPTPFHGVSTMVSLLSEAGFTELSDDQSWSLKQGGKYYVVRNGSSIVAFVNGSEAVSKSGVRIVGAHTDSPCPMLKPQPEIQKGGFCQLGVEIYGGALLNPWFDRDLSIAGRVVYKDANQELKQTLINFKHPVATIPSLAIHLDRNANKDRTINPQTDIPPIVKLNMGNQKSQNFRDILQQQFLTDQDQVMDFELCLFDTQPAAMVGLDQEFLASGRLDNLLSCFVATQALIKADGTQTCIMACNDHEEVGSVSAVGADGPFLESVIAKIAANESGSLDISAVMDKSLLISCDNAHAVHPNYMDKHDADHLPSINGGPVIKTNVKQRYATNSVTSSRFKQLCEQANVPVQQFVSRSDMGCGSTIGPIASSRLGVATIDVGIAQLAMHSCRELTGSKDSLRLAMVLGAFFSSDEPMGCDWV
ncbi:MAG: M18 family aminopeptidase [Porticoccaceae bacterium]|nr:M18 family aminopeptidase [Porticoccaceae bacterium]